MDNVKKRGKLAKLFKLVLIGLVILALFPFWPFLIGGFLIYWLLKKFKRNKVIWLVGVVILLPTLLIGGAWSSVMLDNKTWTSVPSTSPGPIVQIEYVTSALSNSPIPTGVTTSSPTIIATNKPVSTPILNSPTSTPRSVTQTPSTKSTVTGGNCLYSCSSPDRDCSDFSSHSQAQTFFNCCGFSASYDPMKLDSVGYGDGIACEGN